MPQLELKQIANELASEDKKLCLEEWKDEDRELKEETANDTFPKLFREACKKWSSRVALRQKDYGIWHEYTWNEYYRIVKYFCLGLLALGMGPGDRVSIVGNNEVPWWFAMMAIQAGRGVPSCGIFPNSLPDEFQYQLNNAGSIFLVCEDQEQVDKTLEIRGAVPTLKKIIYWDRKGLKNYNDPILISLDDTLRLGANYNREHPDIFDQGIDEGTGEDLAILAYSSGTTGRPKGVMLPYSKLGRECRDLNDVDITDEFDEFLSFTPLGWPMDVKVFGIRHLLSGGIINFPEEPETALENLRELPVSMTFLAPRLQEMLVKEVMVKVSDADWLKRITYKLFLSVGYKIANMRFNSQEPGLFWKLMNFIGYWLVYRPIRDKLGLLHVKHVWSGGAAVSPDAFRFLIALGVPIKQLYGTVEAGITFLQKDNEVKFGSAGKILPGSEMRISDEGELILRTPCCMSGYWENPEATEKYFAGGWLHTGDSAYLDEDGQLVIVDRVVDLMKLDDGIGFSPMFIENKLKFSPYIKDAIIVGDKKPFVAAMISIDYNYMGKWAEDHRIAYTTYPDLSQKQEVYDLIENDIGRVNRELPERVRIRKMVNLYKELDADDSELTRSAKLRRGFVAERYKDIVDAIYSGSQEYSASTEVTYRDGLKTTIKTSINIRDIG